jgi:hypothetical protein
MLAPNRRTCSRCSHYAGAPDERVQSENGLKPEFLDWHRYCKTGNARCSKQNAAFEGNEADPVLPDAATTETERCFFFARTKPRKEIYSRELVWLTTTAS